MQFSDLPPLNQSLYLSKLRALQTKRESAAKQLAAVDAEIINLEKDWKKAQKLRERFDREILGKS